MTESEWLASQDPGAMLTWMRRPRGPFLVMSTGDPRRPNVEVSDRKLRLFAAACCRVVWEKLGDGSRKAIEVSEKYADGKLSEYELFSAYQSIRIDSESYPSYELAVRFAVSPERHRMNERWVDTTLIELSPSALQADLLRDICGNPFRPVTEFRRVTDTPAAVVDYRTAEMAHWLRHNGGTVLHLAREIYGEEVCGRCGGAGDGSGYTLSISFRQCPGCHGTGKVTRPFNAALMPMLADALEDAGCTDVDILNHCRGLRREVRLAQPYGEPVGEDTREVTDGWVRSNILHVRGCWVIDLLLGYS